MASRIKGNQGGLFECFLEISKPVYSGDNNNVEKEARVINTYPGDFGDEKKLKEVPHFVFPCIMDISTVQNFSFVLTNLEAQWTFGFCRLAPGPNESALVILSHLGWHELFYKLLNFSAELLATSNTDNEGRERLKQLLMAVHDAPVPTSGIPVHVSWSLGQEFVAQTPHPGALPSIPENRNLTEYLNAVGVDNMIVLFASLLHERRVIVTSRRLSRLSASVQAANALIYPMQWQHLFIPVLPSHLVDYLSAPMPYLIGVPMPIMHKVALDELGDVVVLNADLNQIVSPYTDLQSMPLDVIKRLKHALKAQSGLLGDVVARAFLQALVQLIGGYRDALKFRQGEKITFSEEDFVRSRPASLQPFLQQMLHLQIFRQFVDERLVMLNEGRGSSDEFEMEVMRCQQQLMPEQSNNKLRLQQVRREGGALVKAVKSKANPAVKNAVKTVKEGSKGLQYKGKSAYREMRSRMKPNFSSTTLDNHHLGVPQEAVEFSSAPSSPTRKRSDSISSTSSGTSYESSSKSTRGDKGDSGSRILGRGGVQYDRFDSTALVDHDDLEQRQRQENNDFEDRFKPLDLDLMSDLKDIIFTGNKEDRNNGKKEEAEQPPPPVPRHLKPSLRRTVAMPLPDQVEVLSQQESQPDSYENDPFRTDHVVQGSIRQTLSEPVGQVAPSRPARRRDTLIDLGTGRIDPKKGVTRAPNANRAKNDVGVVDDLIRLEQGNNAGNANEIIFDPLLERNPKQNSNQTPETRLGAKTSVAATPSPDALLREYGLDFSNLAVATRGHSRMEEQNSLLDLSDLDPLRNNGSSNEKGTGQPRASWTTFD